MSVLLRGQLYWADLDPVRGHEQAGRRPVLIISEAATNIDSNMAVVLPVTSSRQRIGFPYAMRLRSVAMRRPSWVLPRQIRAASGERMLGYIGRISNAEMKDVVRATLRHVLPTGDNPVISDYPDML